MMRSTITSNVKVEQS